MGIVINQSIKATVINYIGVVIGFVTTMFVVTKYLQPEEIGLTKVIYEIAVLFSVFSLLGTTSSSMRFFPYFRDEKSKNHAFFFYMTILPVIGCALFIPLYFLLDDPITDFFKEKSSLLIDYYCWIPVLIVFFVFWSVAESYSTLNFRIAVPKFIREVVLRLLLLAVYLMYAFHLLNLDEFVGSFIMVYGISMLASMFYIFKTAPITFRHDNSFVSPDLRRKIFHYTSFLILGALGNTIIAKLDLFMVSSEIGLASAGIYTIAVYMIAMIEIPSRSITAISSPLVAKELKEGNLAEANKLYRKVSLHQFMAASSLFLLIWINIDNIFAIIPNGDVYEEGKWVVFFIGVAKIIEVSLNFGSYMVSFSNFYYWEFFFSILMTGVTILTNLWLIPIMGISGAAVATLITTLFVLSFKQWIILVKIKGNPWSFSLIKQFALIICVFGVNLLIPKMENVWMDLMVRSAITFVFIFVLAIKMQISQEVNQVVRTIWQKISVGIK